MVQCQYRNMCEIVNKADKLGINRDGLLCFQNCGSGQYETCPQYAIYELENGTLRDSFKKS